jgi:hypothetical protein
MPYKGIGIVWARKQARALTGGEARLLAALRPEDQAVLQTALPGNRIADDVNDRIYAAAAATLFPGDAKGVWAIGRQMARDNLTGIYKILLRLTTVPFIIDQTAKLWHTYPEHGSARAEKVPGEKRGRLVVTEFPGFTACMREMLSGYVTGTLELTGARDVRVTHDDRNRAAWVWEIRWE